MVSKKVEPVRKSPSTCFEEEESNTAETSQPSTCRRICYAAFAERFHN